MADHVAPGELAGMLVRRDESGYYFVFVSDGVGYDFSDLQARIAALMPSRSVTQGEIDAAIEAEGFFRLGTAQPVSEDEALLLQG